MSRSCNPCRNCLNSLKGTDGPWSITVTNNTDITVYFTSGQDPNVHELAPGDKQSWSAANHTTYQILCGKDGAGSLGTPGLLAFADTNGVSFETGGFANTFPSGVATYAGQSSGTITEPTKWQSTAAGIQPITVVLSGTAPTFKASATIDNQTTGLDIMVVTQQGGSPVTLYTIPSGKAIAWPIQSQDANYSIQVKQHAWPGGFIAQGGLTIGQTTGVTVSKGDSTGSNLSLKVTANGVNSQVSPPAQTSVTQTITDAQSHTLLTPAQFSGGGEISMTFTGNAPSETFGTSACDCKRRK